MKPDEPSAGPLQPSPADPGTPQPAGGMEAFLGRLLRELALAVLRAVPLDGKRCRACGVHKSLDDFAKRPDMPDGREYRCKKCEAARVAEHARRAKAEAPHPREVRRQTARLQIARLLASAGPLKAAEIARRARIPAGELARLLLHEWFVRPAGKGQVPFALTEAGRRAADPEAKP